MNEHVLENPHIRPERMDSSLVAEAENVGSRASTLLKEVPIASTTTPQALDAVSSFTWHNRLDHHSLGPSVKLENSFYTGCPLSKFHQPAIFM